VLNIEELDLDGAIREAEDAVQGDSRADFFRKAAITGGAVVGGGTLLGAALPDLALAKPSKKQDVAILNYALTLEYLEAAFYKEAVSKGALAATADAAAKVIAKHEAAHVKFLKAALGKKAVKKPKFDFKGTTGETTKFIATAIALEDTGVAAYAGQGPRLSQVPLVKAALSIHSVEARHAAAVRTLTGKQFAPRAFDKPKSMKQVLKVVGQTGFITK
jgi:rubrerythrin